MSRTRLVLADEDVLLRSALAATLDGEAGFDVVAQAGDAAAALLEVARCEPQVLLLSATLPGRELSGICSAAVSRAPSCRILVMADGSDHSTMLDAFDAGGHGYFAKSVPLDGLLSAVAALVRGEAAVPPHMLGGLLHQLVVSRRRQGPAQDRLLVLSRREREVLGLLADGHARDAIAKRLVISPQTARTHIQNVISKLGVHSRVEAVAVAIESGSVRAS